MIKNNQSGFTLVELITSITIIAILTGIVLTFGVNGLSSYNYSYNRGLLLDDAHLGIINISETVLHSAPADNNNRVEDPNGPGAPGNLFGWESDDDTLILATVAEDDDGNILFQDESQYISHKNNIIYYLNNGNLMRRVLAADIPDNSAVTTCPEAAATADCPEDTVIVENVESFEVKYFDSQNIEVNPNDSRSIGLNIGLAKNAGGRDIRAEYATRTVFRND
jgi:prepilin-type N-terminal cleavage/methylation domain-containing protein